MLDEEGLSNYGTDAARACQTGDGREEVNEKGQEIAHFRMVAISSKLSEFRAN